MVESMCVHVRVHVCTGVCVYVHRLMREIVSMHMHIHAYVLCMPLKLFVCVQ